MINFGLTGSDECTVDEISQFNLINMVGSTWFDELDPINLIQLTKSIHSNLFIYLDLIKFGLTGSYKFNKPIGGWSNWWNGSIRF